MFKQAAKIRYMSGGQAKVPLTLLSFGGGGLNAGPQHSGTYEAWLGSVPGLKVATPATPADVKGLIKTAIREDDPVVVIMHKGLLQSRGEAPPPDELVPLGQAVVRREGRDVTIVTWAGGLRRSLAAAGQLAEEGIEAEVVDLRSIQPLDVDTVAASMRKTRRLLVVQETVGFCGVGAEVAFEVGRVAFDYLDAPMERVAAPFAPTPFSPPLEKHYLPQVDDVVERARAVAHA
jgi:pyruvate dehydrogenase E1 component beta subunit